ncbi:subtilase family serine protease [Luteimonas sp. 3794]|nr:subtilase family serine protease [Luteimonas sp. 3794]
MNELSILEWIALGLFIGLICGAVLTFFKRKR